MKTLRTACKQGISKRVTMGHFMDVDVLYGVDDLKGHLRAPTGHKMSNCKNLNMVSQEGKLVHEFPCLL